MLHFLPAPIRGSLSFLLYVVNTIFWATPILILAIVKLPPVKIWQTWITHLLDFCATSWITLNNLTSRIFTRIRWDIKGIDNLSVKDWYLVIANHQSWVDILVLQKVFNHKAPFLKFFLKKELIYVPVIGVCWWALDFPFMQRLTAKQLADKPELKGTDIATTRKACEKFRYKPVSVMNFLEGTRFTQHKHDKQQSPFTHLLKPKAGGISFVLNAMGEHLHKLLDVTICYPKEIPTFWDYISGKVQEIKVRVRVLPIDSTLIGDYEDPLFKQGFQAWVNQLWLDKDLVLTELKQGERS